MLMLFHQSRGLGGEVRGVCMGWGGGHVQKNNKKKYNRDFDKKWVTSMLMIKYGPEF